MVANKVKIDRKKGLDVDVKKWIMEGLGSYAVDTVGSEVAIEPFTFVALDEEGSWIGGLTGKTFWGALKVDTLYVPKEQRGKRIGQQLMEEALEWGREHGCRFSTVETFSFQALDFYKKLGYEVEFSQDGYDQGQTFYHLKRVL